MKCVPRVQQLRSVFGRGQEEAARSRLALRGRIYVRAPRSCSMHSTTASARLNSAYVRSLQFIPSAKQGFLASTVRPSVDLAASEQHASVRVRPSDCCVRPVLLSVGGNEESSFSLFLPPLFSSLPSPGRSAAEICLCHHHQPAPSSLSSSSMNLFSATPGANASRKKVAFLPSFLPR